MALDEQSVALRAMEALGLDERALPRLVTLIPNAKRRLALNVHADPRRRDSLRKSFALTVSSGAASLTTHLAAAEPLLLDTVRAADIRSSSSTYKWQWKGNRSLLAINPAGTDFIGYTLEGTTIYTDSSDAAATMFAGYEPTLATVESLGLDDELVELVAAMAVPGKEAAA